MPSASLLAFRAGSGIARTLPPRLLQPLSTFAGLAASRGSRGMLAKRAMVARHLRRVYGPGIGGAELEAKVDEVFASYGRYYAESLRLPSLGFFEIDSAMSSQGIDHIGDAIEAGRGCILALPHLGGWEWAGMWLIEQGFPMTVVVEALEPPDLFDWFVKLRQSYGMQVVPVGKEAGAAVLRALKANQVVCLLCDRNIGDSAGVEVEFFGEKTSLPAGPATLALRTGAALLPTAVYFAGRDSHLGLVRPPIDTSRHGTLRQDVQRVTQDLARDLEELIRREPTQWHLLQPNWPSDEQSPGR